MHRIRSLLVIAEVALALVALVGAGLFAESFRRARSIHPGFEADKIVLAQFHVATFCRSNEERNRFVVRLTEHLRALAGVERVSYSDAIPLALGSHPWTEVQVQGYVAAPGEDTRVASNEVGAGFLQTLGIPLVEGRNLNDHDTPETTPVVVVSEALSRRFAGRNPLGMHIRMRGRTFTVVGVAKNIRFGSLTDSPKPYLYYSYRQIGGGQFWIAFYIRTTRSPADIIPVLRREIAKVDPNAAVAGIMPYEQFIAGASYPQKVAATLLSGMGLLSLVLAAVGIYGVLSFAVAQRRREIGIRLAIGASPEHVLWAVVRHGSRLALGGILAGLAITLVAVKPVSPLLVGVRPADPLIPGGAALFLALVAALASYVPARAATRVDPMIAMRQQ